MLKLGNIDIGSVFLGGAEISNIFLGNQLVYENGWHCVPQNGVIVDGATVSTEITSSGYTARSGYLQVSSNSTATFSGVVFGKNSTTLSITYSGGYNAGSVYVDGVEQSSITTISLLPFIGKETHTIEIRGRKMGATRISAMSFNIE